jgi:hypothetical protein
MKNLLLVVLCSLMINVLLAQSDPEPTFQLPRTIVKLSPFQFAASTLELGIETFNPTYSKSFNLSVGLRSGSNDYNDGKGVSCELAFRKYAAPMKFRSRGNRQYYQGIYYTLFAKGEYFKGENIDYYYTNTETYTEKTFAVTPGFAIGFQRTFWQIIFMDVFVGGGVKFSNVDYLDTPPADYDPHYDIFDPGYSGIYPKIGVKIGIGL